MKSTFFTRSARGDTLNYVTTGFWLLNFSGRLTNQHAGPQSLGTRRDRESVSPNFGEIDLRVRCRCHGDRITGLMFLVAAVHER